MHKLPQPRTASFSSASRLLKMAFVSSRGSETSCCASQCPVSQGKDRQNGRRNSWRQDPLRLLLFSHVIAVPLEKVDIADWLFNLPEAAQVMTTLSSARPLHPAPELRPRRTFWRSCRAAINVYIAAIKTPASAKRSAARRTARACGTTTCCWISASPAAGVGLRCGSCGCERRSAEDHAPGRGVAGSDRPADAPGNQAGSVARAPLALSRTLAHPDPLAGVAHCSRSIASIHFVW